MDRIPYTRPSITALERLYAADAVANGWGEHCYDYIQRFERAFCEHLGVEYAIATSSCTGALHLGMAALGLGPGDEVILADTNWIATAAPIAHLGAKPVFVDVLRETWCIDPELIEPAITPSTRAIVATHLYGNLCDMDAILAIGAKHGIPVIEDAAEAIGSVYRGRRAGSIGLFGTFSFHGTKTITTGEGGMFVTNDATLYEKVLTLSNHGRSRAETRQFWPEVVGYKYKMSNIQAAIGCAQLERVEQLVSRRREILAAYRNLLLSRVRVSMNSEQAETQIGAWMPTVVFWEENAEAVSCILRALRSAGIDARVFFHPLSSLPMFFRDRVVVAQNPVAAHLSRVAFNLPSFYDIRNKDIREIADLIAGVVGARQAEKQQNALLPIANQPEDWESWG